MMYFLNCESKYDYNYIIDIFFKILMLFCVNTYFKKKKKTQILIMYVDIKLILVFAHSREHCFILEL